MTYEEFLLDYYSELGNDTDEIIANMTTDQLIESELMFDISNK